MEELMNSLDGLEINIWYLITPIILFGIFIVVRIFNNKKSGDIENVTPKIVPRPKGDDDK